MEAATTSTRERLLAAAQALIEEGGYGAASVIAIADRAGVAAGTLYRHFASKEELFVEVFRSVCEREERAMRAACDDRGEARGLCAETTHAQLELDCHIALGASRQACFEYSGKRLIGELRRSSDASYLLLVLDLAQTLDHTLPARHNPGHPAEAGVQIDLVRLPLRGGKFGLLWRVATRLGVVFSHSRH